MEVEAKTGAAAGRHPVRERPANRYAAPEFPGCRPITIRRDEVDTWDGRFEFWDAATETAWVVREPTSATHEFPSHLLSALSHMIASERGSPVTCFGNMDLELRGEDGERRKIMQADQSVYLHPERSRLPDRGMIRGEHDFPDVVLEVDFTTDVRRGKLGLYEEWGFPEVWVEVPNRYSPSRPARRPRGVTIHRLENGAYRTAPESLAFPGWTAEEIHAALNEPTVSEDTVRVLKRGGPHARGARGHRPRRHALASRAPPGRVGPGTRRGTRRGASRRTRRRMGRGAGPDCERLAAHGSRSPGDLRRLGPGAPRCPARVRG